MGQAARPATNVAMWNSGAPRATLFRRLKVARKPANRSGLKRVESYHLCFGVAALWALKRALLEAFRLVRNGSRFHPHLTLGTARGPDWQQLWIRFSHDLTP